MGKEGKRWCVTPLEEEPTGFQVGRRRRWKEGARVIALAISKLLGAPTETTQAMYFVYTTLWVSGGGVKENQGF